MIAAANKIRTKPYVYGGGHARWWDSGYDCSGSVSYALHGGDFLESPLPSGPMAKLGPGRRRPLDHRLLQPRPRLRGDRRLSAGTPPATTDGEHRPAAGTKTCATSAGFVARHPAGLLNGSGRRPYSAPANRPGRVVLAFLNSSDNVLL